MGFFANLAAGRKLSRLNKAMASLEAGKASAAQALRQALGDGEPYLAEGGKRASQWRASLAAGHALLGRHLAGLGEESAADHLLKARALAELSPSDTTLLARLLCARRSLEGEAWEVYQEHYAAGGRAAEVDDFLRANLAVTPQTGASQVPWRGARCQELLQAGADMFWLRHAWAYAALAEGRDQQARSWLLALSPSALALEDRALAGQLLATLGEGRLAQRMLADLALTMPNHPDHLLARALLLMAEHALLQAGEVLRQWEAAAGGPAYLVEMQKGHMGLLLADFALARQAYLQARALDGAAWQPEYWLGRVEAAQGRWEQAAWVFVAARDKGAPAEAAYGEGLAWEMAGDHSRAVRAYELAREEASLAARAGVRLGVALLRAGRPARAVAALQEALRRREDLGLWREAPAYLLGFAHLGAGDPGAALETWLEVEGEPWRGLLAPRLALARCLLAQEAFVAGDHQGAMGHWSRALPELGPEARGAALANLREAEFRLLAGLEEETGERLDRLARLCREDDSPRSAYYGYLLELERADDLPPPPPALAGDPHFGDRAWLHHAVARARKGRLGEGDLERLGGRGPEMDEAILWCRLLDAMERQDEGGAAACLGRMLGGGE